jgi:hypothetical protein
VNSWYIDSLDVPGGLAFASLRARDDDERTAYGDAAHTYFIAPPFFVPEPATRSVALAARRGTFQTGFYLGDSEHAFEELSHVVEFVRRAYLGNEGTEPTPGAGLGPPPATPEGEPNRGPWDFRGGPLADAFATFDRLSVDLGNAEACAWSAWLNVGQHVDELEPVPDLVANSIGSVADELLTRRQIHGDNAASAVRSWAAFGAIVRLVTPLDFTFSEGTLKHLHGIGLPEDWRQIFVHGETSARFGDPYEAMRCVPVPGWLRERLRPRAPNVETLAHLLSLVMSSPAHVPVAERARVAELILLCAAAIVAPAAFGAEVVAGPIPLGEKIMEDAWRGLTKTALTWCAASLPSLKFDVMVEKAIQSAPSLAGTVRREHRAEAAAEGAIAARPNVSRDDDENEEQGDVVRA